MTNPGAGMPCPVCKVALVMSDRQGVEIDYCPQCRGVWLDRGELDKIIERSAQGSGAPPPQRDDRPRHYGDDDGRHRDHREHGRRRKSFFEDLFD
ncbi:MAG: uncharacterized protein QOD42_3609 [Sphingomonadales bacterium]|jgi:Zn-finger nucleic acid-binding protein|nr:uncharacterized protein [Sphingomonadales bacterium]